MKNNFADKVAEMENNGATTEELATLLGRGRAKKGMFEGDLMEGELEIGQVSSQIKTIQSVKEVIDEMVIDYHKTIKLLNEVSF